jgi:NDP-4-keto-2,6-dideoxyhexose 3-C-methyltransferase
MTICRAAHTETVPLFSLGELAVSNFLPFDSTIRPKKAPLSLCMGQESKLVQLEHSLPPGDLYGKYWYRSGTNNSMQSALKNVVDAVCESVELQQGDVWLDIASNDGTLLSFVPKGIIRVGIDPVEEAIQEEARKHGDDVMQDFFSAGVYHRSRYGDRKAKVVTIIAMFYDLDDPQSFLANVDEVMDDEGLLVLKMSYTPLMVKQLAFDNICHEHVCYYSLTSMKWVLERAGFQIVDCELNDVNGGSFRVYARKAKADKTKFRTAPARNVADFRIQSLLHYETSGGFNSPEIYREFYHNLEVLREQTVGFIREALANGKTVWGYGASTKGNTLLQWFGLDSTLIQGIAERAPQKWGLSTVGTHIPIYSEEDMRKIHPDYLLILPWHFVGEFRQREFRYLKTGGAFIVPCPKFEVIRG